MIKILHTADLHLGLEFSRYPSIMDKLKAERLNALKYFVNRANEEEVHAIVVAGDLFDKLTVPQKLVKEVKSILAMFSGEVLVISGNHDWYNDLANENKVWSWFEEAPGNNVHFLKLWQPYSFNLNNQEVVFYPCGCHQKHFENNLINWVQESNKKVETINIGIAHGNVDGYGLDEEGKYFNMTLKDLKEAEVDCWLLGHIHAPYPRSVTAGKEVFFFAGNHCADNWKSERAGGAWLIEIDDVKDLSATRWNYSGICFKDRTVSVNSPNDVQSVLSVLEDMNAGQTVLRLILRGSLAEEELHDARIQIEAILETFLYAETFWNIGLRITADAISKLYVKDSITYTLLTNLSQSEEDQLAMQLAYETIKNLSK